MMQKIRSKIEKAMIKTASRLLFGKVRGCGYDVGKEPYYSEERDCLEPSGRDDAYFSMLGIGISFDKLDPYAIPGQYRYVFGGVGGVLRVAEASSDFATMHNPLG